MRLCQKASATALGAGSSRAVSRPEREAISHAIKSSTGSAQESAAFPAQASSCPARHDWPTRRSVGRTTLAIVSPNGPILASTRAPLLPVR